MPSPAGDTLEWAAREMGQFPDLMSRPFFMDCDSDSVRQSVGEAKEERGEATNRPHCLSALLLALLTLHSGLASPFIAESVCLSVCLSVWGFIRPSVKQSAAATSSSSIHSLCALHKQRDNEFALRRPPWWPPTD